MSGLAHMTEWHLIFLMAIVTYLPRYLPMGLAGRISLSPAVIRALDFVPIAVLTGIIAQAAFVREGALAFHWENPHAVATLVAFVIGVYRRNLLLTIASGLLVFGAMRLLV